MERLTRMAKCSGKVIPKAGKYTVDCAPAVAYQRLADYENTGLTPDEINAQQWIDVNQDTPKSKDPVLVFCVDVASQTCFGEIASYQHGYWNFGYPKLPHTVTHWMPLPKPPKEVHDE